MTERSSRRDLRTAAGGVLALLALPMLASAAPPPRPVPVYVGGDPRLDACATLASPAGLDPHHDGFLSLREGPGVRWREIARLGPERRLLVCGEQGGWAAVLVPRSGVGVGVADCGVGTPLATRRRYAGACQAGWVARRLLAVEAG